MKKAAQQTLSKAIDRLSMIVISMGPGITLPPPSPNKQE
jgi:hypothetical protein